MVGQTQDIDDVLVVRDESLVYQPVHGVEYLVRTHPVGNRQHRCLEDVPGQSGHRRPDLRISVPQPVLARAPVLQWVLRLRVAGPRHRDVQVEHDAGIPVIPDDILYEIEHVVVIVRRLIGDTPVALLHAEHQEVQEVVGRLVPFQFDEALQIPVKLLGHTSAEYAIPASV